MFEDRFEDAKTINAKEPNTIPDWMMHPFKQWATEHATLSEQQFRREKHAALGEEIDARLKAALDEDQKKKEQEIDEELALEEKALEASAGRGPEIPVRQLAQTSEEYADVLSRQLIRDTRELAARVSADTDVRLIADLRSPHQIAGILDDAFLGGHVAVIARIGLAAEAKLERLAIAERRSGTQVHGEADTTYKAVTAKLAKWRKENASLSPSVKRQEVIERAKVRKQVIHFARTTAERAFQVDGVMKALKQKAEVEAARAHVKPLAGNVVRGMAFG